MRARIFTIGLVQGLLMATGFIVCGWSVPALGDSNKETSLKPRDNHKALEKWVYDPTNKWDPFVKPEPNIIEDDVAYSVDQMVLFGVLQGPDLDRAFIKLPNGSDRIIKLGDRLGKHNGVVSEIGPDYIMVEEKYYDPTSPDTIFVIKRRLSLVSIQSK